MSDIMSQSLIEEVSPVQLHRARSNFQLIAARDLLVRKRPPDGHETVDKFALGN